MNRHVRIVSLTPSRVDRDSRTFKQAASMARFGYESIVVEALRSDLDPERLPFQLISPERPPGANDSGDSSATDAADHSIGARIRRGLNRAAEVPATIWNELHDGSPLPEADLYWLHGYHQYPAVRATDKPFVYDAHDFYPEVIEGGAWTAIEGWMMRRFYLALERRCGLRADHVVTVSDGVADLIAARIGRRPRIVRNVVDLRLVTNGGPDVRATCGVPADAFLVVMPGNHKPGMRAIDEAVAAMQELPEHVHLAFVGNGYDHLASERIHTPGPVPADQLAAFIRTADAVAVLYVANSQNIAYALPNGFFVGIAAGLPLLFPSLPEIARVAREHDLGFAIDPTRPASIAAGVRSLLDDPASVCRFRANALQARQILNWEHEEPELKAIAEAALARS